MPPTKSQQLHVKRLLNKYDQACQSFAFKGAQMPEIHQHIEQQYQKSREALEKFIYALMEK